MEGGSRKRNTQVVSDTFRLSSSFSGRHSVGCSAAVGAATGRARAGMAGGGIEPAAAAGLSSDSTPTKHF